MIEKAERMAEQQANKKCHKVVTCMVIQFS